MNCLCNLFNDPIVWLIIIALILLFMNCDGGEGCGCGAGRSFDHSRYGGSCCN